VAFRITLDGIKVNIIALTKRVSPAITEDSVHNGNPSQKRRASVI
jgi:hypothetical protein